MVTDEQVRLLRQKRMDGKLQQAAAAAAGMSVRTARKWERGSLPSERKSVRTWRTRPDPFEGVWSEEIVPLLHRDEGRIHPRPAVARHAARSLPTDSRSDKDQQSRGQPGQGPSSRAGGVLPLSEYGSGQERVHVYRRYGRGRRPKQSPEIRLRFNRSRPCICVVACVIHDVTVLSRRFGPQHTSKPLRGAVNARLDRVQRLAEHRRDFPKRSIFLETQRQQRPIPWLEPS